MLRVLFVLGAFASSLTSPARGADFTVAVIVHPSRTIAITAEQVARIYRKQQRFWSDGKPILPINRPAGEPLRRAFSAMVFGAARGHMADYWNAQYFHGVFPPPTLPSDASVKRFVAGDPASIGYVDARHVDSTVRVVLRLTLPGRRNSGPSSPRD